MGFFDNEQDRLAKQKNVYGYVQLSTSTNWKNYNAIQMDEIFRHRDEIFERYRNINGITRDELKWAQKNRKTLTPEQIEDIVARIYRSMILMTCGTVTNGRFFVLTDYENVVVDAEDIFAVGFEPAKGVFGREYDGLTYAFFTNDPYVPVFRIAIPRENIRNMSELLAEMPMSLEYPIDTLKALKKTIKKEKKVRGNLEPEYMLKQISNISSRGLPIDLLTENSRRVIEYYGYICNTDVNKILKMDSMLAGRFWKKELDKYRWEVKKNG